MSTHNMLGIVLNDILRTITPSLEDWEIRLAIINDLRSTAESVESLRGKLLKFVSAPSNVGLELALFNIRDKKGKRVNKYIDTSGTW